MAVFQNSFELLNSAVLLATDHGIRTDASPGSEGAVQTNSWRDMTVIELAAPISMHDTYLAYNEYRTDLSCYIHIHWNNTITPAKARPNARS